MLNERNDYKKGSTLRISLKQGYGRTGPVRPACCISSRIQCFFREKLTDTVELSIVYFGLFQYSLMDLVFFNHFETKVGFNLRKFLKKQKKKHVS